MLNSVIEFSIYYIQYLGHNDHECERKATASRNVSTSDLAYDIIVR